MKNSETLASNSITALFVDIYGVLHEGGELIGGAKEALEKFKCSNRKIIILSNTTAEGEDAEKSLSSKGLFKDLHYDDVITSGDVFIEHIKKTKGAVFTEYAKYSPFKKYSVPEAANIGEAENIYIGIPKDDEGADIKLLDLLDEGQTIDSLIKSENPKLNFIERIWRDAKGKKFYCANSDVVAVEHGDIVIRQGFVGLFLKNKGADVTFFGKPYREIFNTALEKHGLIAQNVLMVGDQYSTDLGCRELGIKTALVFSKITDLTKDVAYFDGRSTSSFEPDFKVGNIAELEYLLRRDEKIFVNKKSSASGYSR